MCPSLAGGFWISAGRSYFTSMSLETLAPAVRSKTRPPLSDHLKRLESESIEIIREVAAAFDNPVMLYSIGKDSGVMLHLAAKAFFPGTPPFPL
jgi:3'-phosphoadenosine 5'-phosphosulfate sulfotransferase (PAPS reductase)/FAD synthetase